MYIIEKVDRRIVFTSLNTVNTGMGNFHQLPNPIGKRDMEDIYIFLLGIGGWRGRAPFSPLIQQGGDRKHINTSLTEAKGKVTFVFPLI